mgnify:CR=1 FL=1|tara:strand:+ start:868 stop:1701 length:834 start_codon:yes stop_codon:yes gene_type:complete
MKILFNKICDEFKVSSSLNKIIYLNIIIFLVIKVCTSILFLFEINTIELLNKFYLPAEINLIKLQPWSIFSFMFIHSSFIHLILNMLWLYFIGNIFLQWLNNKQLIYIYILGGISGGLFFILGYNYFPVLQKNIENTLALGASASVFAIMMAISIYKPNQKIKIPFIQKITLKNITIFLTIFYVISLSGGNTGGYLAHIGGGLFSFIYIKQLNKNKIFKNIFKNTSKFNEKNSDYIYNQKRNEKNKQIDIILEKISKSGYNSLSKKEKDILFKSSKK